MTTTVAHSTFDAALTAGLHWLYHTEQPVQALVERCGVRITTAARRLRFLPIGLHGSPLIVLELAPTRWTPAHALRATCTLAERELAAFADTLADRGLHYT
ncbi:hypothetical protein, partial [Mycolicibacterium sp. CBMA 361]|uniref:hypothetical protein n=1 Tax=Mycolicibacterium sp. CBMA 361 TaxID=2606610 RepID=UPI0013967769